MAGTGKAASAKATGQGRPRMRHDEAYKAVYRVLSAFQQLMCGYVTDSFAGAKEWFQYLDFERAELVPTEQITPDLARRYVDVLWRVPIVKGRLAGRHIYVVVLVEFQSRVDRYMALRVQSAATRIYEHLLTDPNFKRTGYLAPILPIVLYNGSRRWTAPTRLRDLVRKGTLPAASERAWAPGYTGDSYVVLDVGAYAGRELPAGNIMSLMIRTETMQELDEAIPLLEESMRQLETPELDGLQQQFLTWFYSVMERQGVDCDELKEVETVQNLAKEGKIHTLLDAHIQAAKAKLEAKGQNRGLRRGLKRGRQEGLEQQRKLLQSLAKRRFGAATADRLAACLAEVVDHDRLLAIGDWLVDCASGAELMDRLEGRA